MTQEESKLKLELTKCELFVTLDILRDIKKGTEINLDEKEKIHLETALKKCYESYSHYLCVPENEKEKIDVNDIHGTNRIYHILVNGERELETVFEISGWGVTKKDIEKEKRFRRWLDIAPTITYGFWDETF